MITGYQFKEELADVKDAVTAKLYCYHFAALLILNLCRIRKFSTPGNFYFNIFDEYMNHFGA